MEWLEILCIYSLVSMLVFVFSAAPLSKNDYEVYSLKAIFVFQYEAYKHMKDELNILGIVILETIITVLTLGSSIIMFITFLITYTFMLIWELFCFVFQKRT
jgi:Zn-dependent membrane protease YugP